MTLHERNAVQYNRDDTIYGSKDASLILPKYRFPDVEQQPDIILDLVKDELMLDGNARQNLATFCQTFEEPQLHTLMDLSIDKNLIDKDEYPQTAEMEKRCVNMLADLWNAPDDANTIGTSGIGSSEACMLGGLAMLWRWRAKRRADGKPTDKPNLVCGPVQICWVKFCRYWDIEMRQVPMEESHYFMDAESMLARIDENTIGVMPTFGLTFTGKFEPVEALSAALDDLEKRTGQDVSMHVDAASGGFLAPFCAPDVIWDFRLPRVKSISASGHKFGLAPLGAGWVLWRDKVDLPTELIFHVNYLGGDMSVFQLNFSRPAGQIISQYYLFLRLGRDGYRKVHSACYDTAQFLAAEILKLGPFEMLFDGDSQTGIPALAWRVKADENPGYSLYDLADRLRIRGWQVPAYSLPPNATDVVVQRILVRQGFTKDLAQLLLGDFERALDYFKEHPVSVPQTEKEGGGFKHT